METMIETITIQDMLVRARTLSAEGRRRVIELLGREQDAPLPDHASVDEAIELYLADACSLGRAAEIAGVTRWDIMDRLKERGIPIPVPHGRSVQEFNALVKQLELEGVL